MPDSWDFEHIHDVDTSDEQDREAQTRAARSFTHFYRALKDEGVDQGTARDIVCIFAQAAYGLDR